MHGRIFDDRRSAGGELAAALAGLSILEEGVVLALPRGGVPVAYEVAVALELPLDILVIRKLGAPGHRELAIGAVGTGCVRVLNRRILDSLKVSDEEVEQIAREEQRRVEEKEEFLRGGLERATIAGRSVVLVDAGLATGASMRAAVETAKAMNPKRVIVAVPVAPQETVETLKREVDRVVCVETPSSFHAVGQWYHHFDQSSDDEVRRLLKEASKRTR